MGRTHDVGRRLAARFGCLLTAAAAITGAVSVSVPAGAIGRLALTVAPGYTSEAATVSVPGTPTRHAYLNGLKIGRAHV